MIYYSTGKNPYLPSRGKTVETNNVSVVNELIKSGSVVESEAELFVTSEKSDTVINEVVVEPKIKTKGNPNWKKKK